MEPVVTSREMQWSDKAATTLLGIPSILLMEHAGAGVVRSMMKRYAPPAGSSFTVLCGPGKNGGDGLVAARLLVNAGYAVTVGLIGSPSKLKGDSKTHFRIVAAMAARRSTTARLRLMEIRTAAALKRLPPTPYVVDALFGTGFSGTPRGLFKTAIDWINDQRAATVSIDIPSGLNADDGTVSAAAVKADLTVTMGSKKLGLIVGQGRAYAGILEVVDLGIEQEMLHRHPPSAWLIERADVRLALPKRRFDAHKQGVGKILVLAGSRGMSGAAALAAASALRSGAGVVVLGTPASVAPVLDRKLTEVMVEALPETSRGTLSLDAFEEIQGRLRWADLVILGPGLSRDPETVLFVRRCLSKIRLPMLIDADGLNALAGSSSLVGRKSRELLITPHAGELARLLGTTPAAVELDRVAAARESAKKFRLTLLLKGAPTLVSDERGAFYVNPTGNPGMATAGAGDVLSGCVGALWGQGMERTEAAYAGAYVHGLAGDLARARFGERGLTASDLQQLLPAALLAVESVTAP